MNVLFYGCRPEGKCAPWWTIKFYLILGERIKNVGTIKTPWCFILLYPETCMMLMLLIAMETPQWILSTMATYMSEERRKTH